MVTTHDITKATINSCNKNEQIRLQALSLVKKRFKFIWSCRSFFSVPFNGLSLDKACWKRRFSQP